MKRLTDGTYAEIDWETAISEVVEGFRGVIDRHGPNRIFYYGGGGQGNHLGGSYGAATRRALNINRRSNALAQEKTGEAWVEGRMFGTHTHGHFQDAEVAVFLGKNPWHSHGFDETRRVLKEFANDAKRTMIVIDPRRTETAELADVWLPVKPGTDAFLLAAIGRVIVEEKLFNNEWLVKNANGLDETIAAFSHVPISDFSQRSGIDEATIHKVAHLISSAKSVAFYEDLGIEMAPHSTLVSYLQRVIWVLVGSYGKPGGMSAHTSMAPLFSYGSTGSEPSDPVTGGLIISGLTPCNEIADGILSDHPERSRALFIESANPVHSLAESEKFRQAMRAAEFSVVIDVAMTETALQADYVLPAASQYEKVETTFFNFSFPHNWFCIRPPILEPLGDSLPEPEIHSRIIKALGIVDEFDFKPLREAAHQSLDTFGEALTKAVIEKPELAAIGAVVLYETLGKTLPPGMEGAAALWFSAQQTAQKYPEQVRAAGHSGEGPSLGSSLFETMISSPDGVIFTSHDHDQAWDLLRTDDKKIQLAIPEMLTDLKTLSDAPLKYTSDEFPYVLTAGERRGFTANTIIRNPKWRKKDFEGALRINPTDAESLGVGNGSKIQITTPGGSALAIVEVNDTMMPGHIALPNGLGLGYSSSEGKAEVTGVAPNELTTVEWRDPIAGTPWHKHVPAQLRVLPTNI